MVEMLQAQVIHAYNDWDKNCLAGAQKSKISQHELLLTSYFIDRSLQGD